MVEWSITSDCKSDAFGLRRFKSCPAHTTQNMKLEIAIKKEKQIRGNAKKVLEKLDIIKKLKKFGEVVIEGSYTSRTMVKPDIDISIYSNKINIKQIADLSAKVFAIPGVTSIFLKNRLSSKYGPDINGVSFKVRYEVLKTKWNLDIHFFLSKQKRYTNTVDLSSISENQRNQILLLKNELYEKGLYPGSPKNKNTFFSIEIIKAVIFNEVSSVSGMKKWRKSNPFPSSRGDYLN